MLRSHRSAVIDWSLLYSTQGLQHHGPLQQRRRLQQADLATDPSEGVVSGDRLLLTGLTDVHDELDLQLILKAAGMRGAHVAVSAKAAFTDLAWLFADLLGVWQGLGDQVSQTMCSACPAATLC